MIRIGLDVGSTTIKCVVLDDSKSILFQSYERHFSQITQKMTELLSKIETEILRGEKALLTVSGSAGHLPDHVRTGRNHVHGHLFCLRHIFYLVIV